MKVAVASAPSGAGGVADYADDFERRLPVQTERYDVPDTSNPLPYLSLARRLADGDCDVVHVQFVYAFFGPAGVFVAPFFVLLWAFAKRRGVTVVVTLHEVWHPGMVGDSFSRRRYVGFTHAVLLAASDEVVFLSTVGQSRFGDGTHGTVLHHGVDTQAIRARDEDTARETFDLSSEEFIVAQIGYVNERKNPRLFVEMARRLPEVTFLLAGGPRTERFEDLYESIRDEAPPNCRTTGVLSEDAFHDAFVAADVVVLPYDDITQSGIFNWAAAYGKAVIASDTPYFEALQADYDCVLTFPSGDVAAVVDQLETLRANPDALDELGTNMQRYANENSLDAILEAHVELYRTLERE